MNKRGSIAVVILGIVAVIAIIGLILMFAGKGSVTGNAPLTTGSCFDSDGGKNYYARGALGVGIYSVEDTCLHFPDRFYPAPGNLVKKGPYLSEGYCLTENKTAFEVYTCPNGCADGACIK